MKTPVPPGIAGIIGGGPGAAAGARGVVETLAVALAA